MDTRIDYVVSSLELHLFFARIMKEHALFMEAAYTPASAGFAKEAERFKNDFENILLRTVRLSDGIVGQDVLRSGEIVTEFTAGAEQQTQRFTGIPINRKITMLEHQLRCGEKVCIRPELVSQVRQLNQMALRCLNGLISLKERTLNNVLSCRMFTMNYPLLIEHILREARLYRTYIAALESGRGLDCQSMKQVEQFWNQIMMEHAQFIRGLLDPCENELIDSADGFAEDYAKLLAASCERQDKALGRDAALQETLKFRDFKAAGAQGIQACKIRSVILPLLADHVLREANHYIRLLES